MSEGVSEEPRRKGMSGLSSRGSEGADDRLSRITNAEQAGEDVNAGSAWARGEGWIMI